MESGQNRDVIELPSVMVEFVEFRLEGIINSYFSNKGFPTRIKSTWITEDVLCFTINDYQIAFYFKSLGKLYRLNDCLQLHWMLIKRAVKQTKI